MAWCKGATPQQTQLEASQAQFYDTLKNDYAKQFSYSQNILKSLDATWTPLLKAGPNQYGFTKAEDTALRTQSTSGTADAYKHAQQALHGAESARSGGDTFLPSGTEAQLDSSLASGAADTLSKEQLGITTAGYDRGYNTFMAAANVLGGAAGIANPTGYAGAANTSGSDASKTASDIQQADAASSPWGAIGGILGGAASSFAGGFGGGLGTKVAGCWVAAAVFSEDFYTGPRTNLVRNWLWNEWDAWYAKPVLWLYSRYGEWVSKQPLLVKLFTPLIYEALERANGQ